MGKMIDTDKLKDITEYCILANVPADAENTMEEKWNDWFQTVIDRAQPVEAIPKADYEARLKADLVAMLTEIKDEVRYCEITGLWKTNYLEGFNDGVTKCLDAIQQKINALRGEENE